MEMVVDFHRWQSAVCTPVNIHGMDIERVDSCKYVDVHLNKTTAVSSGGSEGATPETYDSVVAPAILYGVVCWCGSITERDRKKLSWVMLWTQCRR